MSTNSVLVSPEHVDVGRREAPALQLMSAGTLATYSNATIQGVTITPAGEKPPLNLVVTENKAVASAMEYYYFPNETVYLQSLPRGAVVNLKASVGTYAAGTEVEVAADGSIQEVNLGVAVGIMPPWADDLTVIAGDGVVFVTVELY